MLTPKAIVGDLDWVPIKDVHDNTIRKQALAVGYISIPKKDNNRCTAFLINKNIIMTNWHCFERAALAEGARLYLNFIKGVGKNSFTSTRSYDCGEYVFGQRSLDFSLLKCQGKPGETNGFLKLEDRPSPLLEDKEVYLIHQNCDYWMDPECAPTKKFSPGQILQGLDDGYPEEEPIIYHSADTLSGSSGSPLFSFETHKVIGLHHAGPGLPPSAQGRGDRNSAIPMHLIVEFIKKELPQIELESSLP